MDGMNEPIRDIFCKTLNNPMEVDVAGEGDAAAVLLGDPTDKFDATRLKMWLDFSLVDRKTGDPQDYLTARGSNSWWSTHAGFYGANKSILFAGDENWVTLDTEQDFTGNDFTFSGWFKPSGFSSTILISSSSSPNSYLGFMSDSTTIKCRWAGIELIFTVPEMSIGTWYHLMVTVEDGVATRLYLNGVESSTGALNNGSTYKFAYIGRHHSGLWFDGNADDLGYFIGTIATGANAVSIYNLGAGADPEIVLGVAATHRYLLDGSDQETEIIDTGTGGANGHVMGIYAANIEDRSGNGNDFAQTTEDDQARIQQDAGGQRTLVFDTAMFFTQTSMVSTAKNYNCFIYYKNLLNTGSLRFTLDIQGTDRLLFAALNTVARPGIFDGTWRNDLTTTSTGQLLHYIHKASLAKIIRNTITTLLNTATTNVVDLGGGTTTLGDTAAADHEIMELLFIEGDMTADELEWVEGYLAWKGNDQYLDSTVLDDMDAGHTFKAAAP